MTIIEDKATYVNLIASQQSRLPIFYHPFWLDATANNQWSSYVISINEKIIAVFPFYLKNKYGLTATTMPPLTPYLGLWILDKNDLHFYNTIINEINKKLKGILTTISCHFDYIEYKESWEKSNYEIKDRITYFFSESSYEKISNNYSSKLRNDIKFALNNGSFSLNETVESLYECIESSYAAQKIKVPFSKKVCQNIFHEKQSMSKIYSIKKDNKVVASIMTVEDSNRVYYLLSGRKLEAPRGSIAFLIDKAIEQSTNQGKVFDFEGSSNPNIASFFLSFGPQSQYYFMAKKHRYKWLKNII